MGDSYERQRRWTSVWTTVVAVTVLVMLVVAHWHTFTNGELVGIAVAEVVVLLAVSRWYLRSDAKKRRPYR